MTAMKSLPALFILAALGAFVLTPLSFALGGSLFFAAGVAAIALGDYARPRRSLILPAVAAVVSDRRSERFGLAA